MPYSNSKAGLLPKDQTEDCFLSKAAGKDYTGFIYCRLKLKAESLLFSCSVSRVVYLELVPNITATEFIKSFERMTERQEIPKTI